MRAAILLLGLISGAAAGLALAYWLGFGLLDAGNPIAAAAAGLGAGIGLALARSSNARRRHQEEP